MEDRLNKYEHQMDDHNWTFTSYSGANYLLHYIYTTVRPLEVIIRCRLGIYSVTFE